MMKLCLGLLAGLLLTFSARADVDIWVDSVSDSGVGHGDHTTITNVYQISDTNGVVVFDADWGFNGDYPSRLPFGYNDELDVSNSNRTDSIDMGSSYEPSGLFWHDRLNVLYGVDDEGQLFRMEFDGTAKSNYVWEAGLDLEAITVADPQSGYIELGTERWTPNNTAGCFINRMVFGDPFTSTNQQRFDVSAIVTSTIDSAVMEGLTFIPSNAVPSWVGTFSEPLGLYLASCQEDGKFYFIDVPISTTAFSTNTVVLSVATNMIASWVPRMLYQTNRNDCSELYYDVRWNRLYAVYDEDSVEVPASSTRGRSLVLFDMELLRATQEWGLWRDGFEYNNPEGFTLGPDRGWCFIGNDAGNANVSNTVARYRFDAYARETRRWLDVNMPRDPDAEDDGSMGYALGSQWYSSSSTGNYWCVGTNADAAVWTGDINHIPTNSLGFLDGAKLGSGGARPIWRAPGGAYVDLALSSDVTSFGAVTNNQIVVNLGGAGATFDGDFDGDGGGLTNLNASVLESGTVPLAALANIDETDLDASVNASLVLADAAQPGDADLSTLALNDGGSLTNLNATQLISGTVPLAVLANIDETDLDASVNASLDLADAAQPGDADLSTLALNDGGSLTNLFAYSTPASSSAAGDAGTFTYDLNYLYVCVSNATWRRVALPSW